MFSIENWWNNKWKWNMRNNEYNNKSHLQVEKQLRLKKLIQEQFKKNNNKWKKS